MRTGGPPLRPLRQNRGARRKALPTTEKLNQGGFARAAALRSNGAKAPCRLLGRSGVGCQTPNRCVADAYDTAVHAERRARCDAAPGFGRSAGGQMNRKTGAFRVCISITNEFTKNKAKRPARRKAGGPSCVPCAGVYLM
jgi:hypothetical protein